MMAVGTTTSNRTVSNEPIPSPRQMSNDTLIIRLLFTPNFLSRWLTPIHQQHRLMRAPRLGQKSVKDLLIELRNEERRIYPKMHLIANESDPDLDRLPEWKATPTEIEQDREATALEIMAQFRRLRVSTCSLLRSSPDDAWQRSGTSRREHDWTIRTLAEHLASHDERVLREMEAELNRSGVREGIATYAKAPLDELLRLVPTELGQDD